MDLAQKTKLLKEKVEEVYSTIDIPDFPNVDSILKNLTSDKVQEVMDLHVEIRNLLWEDKVQDDELNSYRKDTESIINGWYFANAVKSQCESREVISTEVFLKKYAEFTATESPENSFYFRPNDSNMERCNEATKKFLLKSGLPDYAPFINHSDRFVPHILDEWGSPEDWTEEEREVLKNYSQFGIDASGNPVCIDHNNNDVIVILDHEYFFLPHIFINTSIAQYAESGLAYKAMMANIRKDLAEDAYIDNRFIEIGLVKELEEELTRIDCKAMLDNCFWKEEILQMYNGRNE